MSQKLSSPSVPEEPLWTVKEVAAYLRQSTSWVYKASASGLLPCVHIGASVRFVPADLKAWIRGELTGSVVRVPGLK